MSNTSHSKSESEKPKLLFLSGPHDHLEPLRIVGLIDPVNRWLAYHFDLTIIAGDQDYDAVVSAHQPDIVMFDSGADSFKGRYPVYTKTDTHPEVPKVGFVRNDFHSPMRLNSFGRMESWGVHTFFSPSFPVKGAPQAFRDRTIFVPRWVDDAIFKDYQEHKAVPVSMLGAGFLASDFYPWRRRVSQKVIQYFPFFHAPRPMPRPHMVVGENYARMINRSHFVIGCGGASRSLVSKLFEIPGARSVLVTEDTEIVRDAGFVDGENCVLTDENSVVERIEYLLSHPDELDALTDRGYRFIHDRHSHRNRTHINEWLALFRQMAPDQKIAQTSISQPLELVENDYIQTDFVPFEDTTVSSGVHGGFELLEKGNLDDAVSTFEAMLSTYHYMFEPHLGIGIAKLAQGKLTDAVVRFAQNINNQNTFHCAVEDPVNQAYMALTFLCAGDYGNAMKYARRQPDIRHPLLQVVRWMVSLVDGSASDQELFANAVNNNALNLNSLDPRPPRSFQEWSGHCVNILKVSNQARILEAVSRSGVLEAQVANAS
jgi:hypothetical protein